MSLATDSRIRDRLKEVRDDLAAKRDERARLKAERDSAKDAFGKLDVENSKITETKEFKDAEAAVAALGACDDEIANYRATEQSILQLLGDQAERDGGTDGGASGIDIKRLARWDGDYLMATSDSYKEALSNGRFSSSNQFGTIDIGQICSRENFREGILAAALPTAPAGNIATDQGAIAPDVRGILPPFLKPLSLLDLIPTGVTNSNIVQYVQVTSIPGYAAETAELAAKPQEGLTLVDATAPVRTIAGYFKMARQAMDDIPALASMINALLPYDVRRRLESQILQGDGTGQNILGILNTAGIGAPASATGDNVADGILRAMTTILLSDAEPNFVTLNPMTWQNLLMMKAQTAGTYLYGDPGTVQAPTIWGLTITANRLIPQASPLVGDSRGAMLLVREGVNVRTSDSDQDDFIKNRVTVLAETRVAFPVWRPVGFAKAPIG